MSALDTHRQPPDKRESMNSAQGLRYVRWTKERLIAAISDGRRQYAGFFTLIQPRCPGR